MTKEIDLKSLSRPQVSQSGQTVRIPFTGHDGEDYALIFPSSHLDRLVTHLLELFTAARIQEAVSDRHAQEPAKFQEAPDVHRIKHVHLVAHAAVEEPSETIDLQVETEDGRTMNLCFLPGHLQEMLRIVQGLEHVEQSPDVH